MLGRFLGGKLLAVRDLPEDDPELARLDGEVGVPGRLRDVLRRPALGLHPLDAVLGVLGPLLRLLQPLGYGSGDLRLGLRLGGGELGHFGLGVGGTLGQDVERGLRLGGERLGIEGLGHVVSDFLGDLADLIVGPAEGFADGGDGPRERTLFLFHHVTHGALHFGGVLVDRLLHERLLGRAVHLLVLHDGPHDGMEDVHVVPGLALGLHLGPRLGEAEGLHDLWCALPDEHVGGRVVAPIDERHPVDLLQAQPRLGFRHSRAPFRQRRGSRTCSTRRS